MFVLAHVVCRQRDVFALVSGSGCSHGGGLATVVIIVATAFG